MPLTDAHLDHLRDQILRRIRTADTAASPGLLGSSLHLWKLLVRDDEAETAALVISLFERVALADLSPEAKHIFIHSDLIAGPLGDDCICRIEMPSFVRKIAMSSLMGTLAEKKAPRASGPTPVGLRTSDGTSVAYSLL